MYFGYTVFYYYNQTMNKIIHTLVATIFIKININFNFIHDLQLFHNNDMASNYIICCCFKRHSY